MSQTVHTKWSECQRLPIAVIIMPEMGSLQLEQMNPDGVAPDEEELVPLFLGADDDDGVVGLEERDLSRGFSTPTSISLDPSSARGITGEAESANAEAGGVGSDASSLCSSVNTHLLS